MKVLVEGRKQTGWAKEYNCTGAGNDNGGCGALLLVEEADLFHTYSHAREDKTTYTSFRCPCCSSLTDVKDVPLSVRIRDAEKG